MCVCVCVCVLGEGAQRVGVDSDHIFHRDKLSVFPGRKRKRTLLMICFIRN